MKLIAITVAALTFCAAAPAQKLTLVDFERNEYGEAEWESTGLLLYDTNLRDGSVNLIGRIKGMIPHSGDLGIAMLGGIPEPPQYYTAGPRGPLVISFVQPQTGRPATVRQVSFWVSNPRRYPQYPAPAASFEFLDPDGALIGRVQTTTNLLHVSARGAIASVHINSQEYLMLDDLQFDRPRILSEPVVSLSHAKQLARATQLLDFESLPDGTTPSGNPFFVSNQWQQAGVLFSDESSNAVSVVEPTYYLQQPTSGTHALGPVSRTIVLSFVVPATGQRGTVREVGMWLINTDLFNVDGATTVEFLDARGQILETVTSRGKLFFAGARATRGIARVVLTGNNFFLVDDLQFSPVRRAHGAVRETDQVLRKPLLPRLKN